ncbi:MAG: DUF2061 domain-containing protein [Arenibacter sp.]|uniref:Uncharacterized membrane protein n=2 Tax=Arenibacter TaxID=178469 RepID=A0A1M5EMD7_9FLAO|nr:MULTISPECIES: DUF2061 domain-containing protein [Arenibacter]RAJ16070.1 putative membrane protein [Arenibacter echinorum]SHF80367.1 Uncharacterized membrane protein [Arenibacter palladensis]|tara:strand:+ start:74 stop:499 length:426 start_codon:yes stop_codon:yes gene_type:complete
MDSSHKRHIAKTITWRLVGTVDTIVLSWAITGNPFTGLKIGMLEMFTKLILYYLHERFWFKFYVEESKTRHIIKTISWRIIGTLDTITLSWFITGNALTGLKIGAAEIITKMILYYLHERTWYKINFGLDKTRRAKKWKKT